MKEKKLKAEIYNLIAQNAAKMVRKNNKIRCK